MMAMQGGSSQDAVASSGIANSEQQQESLVENTLVQAQDSSQSVSLVDRSCTTDASLALEGRSSLPMPGTGRTTAKKSAVEQKQYEELRCRLAFPALPFRPATASQQQRTQCVGLLEGFLFEDKCRSMEKLVYGEVVEAVSRLLRGMWKRKALLVPREQLLQMTGSLHDMYLKNAEQCILTFREKLCSLLEINPLEDETETASRAALDQALLEQVQEQLETLRAQQEEAAHLQAHNAALDVLLAELDLELGAAQALQEAASVRLPRMEAPLNSHMADAAGALRQCGEMAVRIARMTKR
ncbi:uncharacterized protein LOC129595916 [Paramacrobiotus metropolitanus]|uniref:uncharacterized protein LOC129595916 n=1 Tax=Paramacrobiotus metropolitanus TaxID=2943436 RepID=UPI0024456BD2|nr:uncharacterized protein LOC129595916 [Paramacrobiotus metropolitanus]